MPQPTDPQSLTFGPFVVRPYKNTLHLRYNESLYPMAGHPLTMEELAQLEALIQFIKSAPKVTYPQTDEASVDK